MRTCVVVVVGAVMLLFQASTLRASEAQELREKAERAKREAVELKNLGRFEESEKLVREAKELLTAAQKAEGRGPGASEQEINNLEQHLRDLVNKERMLAESRASEGDLGQIRERIAQVKNELQGLLKARKAQFEKGEKTRPKKGPLPEVMVKLEETGRRIEHLRIAAEHLHAAGAHDLADQLVEKAGAMEREAQAAKRRLAEAGGFLPEKKPHGGPGFPEHLEKLRQEMERMRDELHELRRQVKEMEQSRR